jgi:hypothetical protein
MPGPAPKDPSLRQRRNRSSTRATLRLEKKPRKRAPSLPRRPEGEEWHEMTKKWWHDLWHSPMRQEYFRVDRHALYRLAELIEQYWRKPSVKLAAEIRLEQQAFGLTPLDRRRLEWSIEQVESVQGKKRKQRVRVEQQDDPRRILKVVS